MHQLTPKATFRNGAQPFLQGECVLIRFSDPLRVDQGLDLDTLAGSASTLTRTANASSPQHFAFIWSSVLLENGSYEVTAYPIISFSGDGGAIAGYSRLPPDDQARLIPLPPLWDECLTPTCFRNRFDLGNFLFSKNSWLLVNPHKFIMPDNRTFKRWDPKVHLTHNEMHQIDVYRNTLRNPPAAAANNGNGQGGPSSRRFNNNCGQRGGRSGSRRGGGIPRGRQGLGATSGPRTRSQDNGMSRKVGEKVVGAGLGPEMSLVIKQWSDLVVEDVDDDAQDDDASYKDELMLLAGPGDSGFCRNELVKLLQAEQKEREEMQQQCVARVRQWQQTTAEPQP